MISSGGIAMADDDPPPTSSETPQQWQSVFRPSLFLHKVALVTGGGSGIGRSIALELAILGATVCIASRDRDKCLAAAEEMNKEVIRQLSRPSSGNGVEINNSNQRCCGRVVVGPSTSIRDEDQVNELVSSLQLHPCMHWIIMPSIQDLFLHYLVCSQCNTNLLLIRNEHNLKIGNT